MLLLVRFANRTAGWFPEARETQADNTGNGLALQTKESTLSAKAK